MKNNKLTAKYIEDVFNFMNVYDINKIEIDLVTLFIENNEYNIISNNNNDEREWHVGDTIQKLLESFKQSKYYNKE